MSEKSNGTTKQQQSSEVGQSTPLNAGGFEPTHEQIASRAYERWLERGSEHGEHEQDWMDAEQDLKNPL